MELDVDFQDWYAKNHDLNDLDNLDNPISAMGAYTAVNNPQLHMVTQLDIEQGAAYNPALINEYLSSYKPQESSTDSTNTLSDVTKTVTNTVQ